MSYPKDYVYTSQGRQATFLSTVFCVRPFLFFFSFFLLLFFTSVVFAARFPFSFVRQSPGNTTCKPPMRTGSATVLCKYTQKYVHACGAIVASRMRCTRSGCVCSPRASTPAKHHPRLVSVLFNPMTTPSIHRANPLDYKDTSR